MAKRTWMSVLGAIMVAGFAYFDSHGNILLGSGDPVVIVTLLLVIGLGLLGRVAVSTRLGARATLGERLALAVGALVSLIVLGQQGGLWLNRPPWP